MKAGAQEVFSQAEDSEPSKPSLRCQVEAAKGRLLLFHDFLLRLFQLPHGLNSLRHLIPQRHLPQLGNPTLHWPQPKLQLCDEEGPALSLLLTQEISINPQRKSNLSLLFLIKHLAAQSN